MLLLAATGLAGSFPLLDKSGDGLDGLVEFVDLLPEDKALLGLAGLSHDLESFPDGGIADVGAWNANQLLHCLRRIVQSRFQLLPQLAALPGQALPRVPAEVAEGLRRESGGSRFGLKPPTAQPKTQQSPKTDRSWRNPARSRGP